VVVGPKWLTCTHVNGQPRIDQDNDWYVLRSPAHSPDQFRLFLWLLQTRRAHEPTPRLTKLPADIAALAHIQSFMFSQLRFGADMDRLVGRLVELVPTLIIPRLFAPQPPPFQSHNAPSTLLRSSTASSPFTGRARGAGRPSIVGRRPGDVLARLVVGPAGCGKSRLVMELAKELRAMNWLAGIVVGRHPRSRFDTPWPSTNRCWRSSTTRKLSGRSADGTRGGVERTFGRHRRAGSAAVARSLRR